MTGHPIAFDGDGLSPSPRKSPRPLVSVIPREVRPFQGLRAGIVSRLVANTIDFVVLAVALCGCYLGINAVRFLWSAHSFQFSSVNRYVAFFVGAGLLAVYLTVAWAAGGRTVGDHVLGLRVVNRHGGPVGWTVAAGRAVLCVAFPIGILWAAVSPVDRSVQDVVLRTSVRYDW